MVQVTSPIGISLSNTDTKTGSTRRTRKSEPANLVATRLWGVHTALHSGLRDDA